MNDETPRSPGEAARLAQRTVWAAAARGWIEDREALLAGMTPVTARLIELAAIAPGQAVLDIASGSGDPAFSIASVVGPAGRVDGFDLVPEMVAGAQAIARARATENVTFRAVASELDIGGADITYDAITCRFGLMFMPDPAAALRTWRSSLRPGGRIALSTWAEFPVLRVVRDVVARRAPVPDVDPSAPGILALPTPDRLRAVLEQAGYEDVAVETLELPLFDDLPADQWWDLMARTAGPLVMLLAALPEETRSIVRADGIEVLGARHPSGVVSERGVALIASAVHRG